MGEGVEEERRRRDSDQRIRGGWERLEEEKKQGEDICERGRRCFWLQFEDASERDAKDVFTHRRVSKRERT